MASVIGMSCPFTEDQEVASIRRDKLPCGGAVVVTSEAFSHLV
jgi:hypothetical protein